MKRTNTRNTFKVESTIVNMIYEKIETAERNGKRLTWTQAWHGAMPRNYKSGKAFNGMNVILSNIFGDGEIEFMTFKQGMDAGYKLKKGSKATPIVFSKGNVFNRKNEDGFPMLDDEGNPVQGIYWVKRYYSEFPLSAWTGKDGKPLESKVKLPGNNLHPIETAEAIIKNYSEKQHLEIRRDTTRNSAFYSPSGDYICVPKLEQYSEAAKYYSTLFHEMVHSTGHESRLNREVKNSFGDEKYSFEELVAEMGSAILMNLVGIETPETLDDSAAYIQSWNKTLKDHPVWLFEASAKARKAVEMICDGMLTEDGTLKDETPDVICLPCTMPAGYLPAPKAETKPKAKRTRKPRAKKATKKESEPQPETVTATETPKVDIDHGELIVNVPEGGMYRLYPDFGCKIGKREMQKAMKYVWPYMTEGQKAVVKAYMEKAPSDYRETAQANLRIIETYERAERNGKKPKVPYRKALQVILKNKKFYVNHVGNDIYLSDTFILVKLPESEYENIKKLVPFDMPESLDDGEVFQAIKNRGCDWQVAAREGNFKRLFNARIEDEVKIGDGYYETSGKGSKPEMFYRLVNVSGMSIRDEVKRLCTGVFRMTDKPYMLSTEIAGYPAMVMGCQC